MNGGDTTWISSNRRRERAKLLCPGSYTTEHFVSNYLQNRPPCLVVAFCLGTAEAGIKSETIIKVKMATVDLLYFTGFTTQAEEELTCSRARQQWSKSHGAISWNDFCSTSYVSQAL